MIREIKCPYGDDFEGGDECDRCEQYELCMEAYPPLNLIEIPKGATNGDMLKITFNPHKIFKFTYCVQVYFSEKYYQLFGIEWWNAPYKRGNENERIN